MAGDRAADAWRKTTRLVEYLAALSDGSARDPVLDVLSGHPRAPELVLWLDEWPDHLEKLIAMARDKRWIALEVAQYAEVLRGHHNLVHPRRQWVESYAPEDDIVRIAWNVVVAALNDLAETVAPTAAQTPEPASPDAEADLKHYPSSQRIGSTVADGCAVIKDSDCRDRQYA
ncbi:hypothetical protein EV191_13023 [Tamaricihabitans halophyticus]|uniref:Uncharacterized protein n=1 Tax=Tamaricihabitans halophyticus TaxID=1262583 RepID=A0A4R2PYL6_9PSEU|nr:hypothetical protein [Tamaricihabitans halophyticus]TCP39375.1 hypothetical protein EV191_13023 [Tamaricihabitans halophyticus]